MHPSLCGPQRQEDAVAREDVGRRDLVPENHVRHEGDTGPHHGRGLRVSM